MASRKHFASILKKAEYIPRGLISRMVREESNLDF